MHAYNTELEGNTMKNIKYDVALSFAGEDREYVDPIASVLKNARIKVFYDSFEKSTLWGKDLFQYLFDIYSNQAKYTIIFISKYYANKRWANHELKAAQERAFKSKYEYILPIKLDETNLPGLPQTTGYLDGKAYSPEDICELIKIKLEYNSNNKPKTSKRINVIKKNEEKRILTLRESVPHVNWDNPNEVEYYWSQQYLE